MATPTYDLLDSTTLGTSAASVTFSSIDQSYGDLILVFDGTGGGVYELIFNSDTTSGIYTGVYATGNASSASSGTNSSDAMRVVGLTGNQEMHISQIMDYSATNKHTTVLTRTNRPSTEVGMWAHRYASTSAITSVEVSADTSTFSSGSTFYLFGVAK